MLGRHMQGGKRHVIRPRTGLRAAARVAVARWPLRAVTVVTVLAAAFLATPASSEADSPPFTCDGPAANISTSFDATPRSGTVVGGEVRCFSLQDVALGDFLQVKFDTIGSGYPSYAVIDETGEFACDLYDAFGGCRITRGSSYRLAIIDPGDPGTSARFNVGAYRLTNPAGCQQLTSAAQAIDGPREAGSLDQPEAADCFTFTTPDGVLPQQYWIESHGVSEPLYLDWQVYDTGRSTTSCHGAIEDHDIVPPNCTLRSGTEHVLVIGAGWHDPGAYSLTVRRLTDPSGCEALPSVAFGTAAVRGHIEDTGSIDCYALPGLAAGDIAYTRLRTVGGDYEQLLHYGFASYLNEAGESQCGANDGTICKMSSGSRFYLFLTSPNSGANGFDYRASANRMNDASGCTTLDAGAASYDGPQLEGSIDGPMEAGCFALRLPEDAEDGSYRIAALRTGGRLEPRWSVYRVGGGLACYGEEFGHLLQECRLRGGGDYLILVQDNSDSQEETGGYVFGFDRRSRPQGCAANPPVAYGADPTRAALASAEEADCYSLGSLRPGDAIQVGLANRSSTRALDWSLRGEDGVLICGTDDDREVAQCPIARAGQYYVEIHEDFTAPSGDSYSFVPWLASDSTSCTALSDSDLSFTAQQQTGSVGHDLDASCFTFERSDGNDGVYWFRPSITSGEMTAALDVLGPDGLSRCEPEPGYAHVQYAACTLRGGGRFTLVVNDVSGLATGTFSVAPLRLDDPQGCVPLDANDDLVGRLNVVGEVDCYLLDVHAGDEVGLGLDADQVTYSVIGSDGTEVCWYTRSKCEFDQDDRVVVAVYAPETFRGDYHLTSSTACGNPPCVPARVEAVSPDHLESGDQAAATTLGGRHLDRLDSVTISKGGMTISGVLGDPSATARGRPVRFDLRGAEAGSWSLDAHFNDGVNSHLEAAITTSAPLPPPEGPNPPNTFIDAGPTNGSSIDQDTATFRFHASKDDGVVFHCSLDGAAFAACSSPWTTSRLSDGRHTVSVRAATSEAGPDPTPASRAFTVSRGGVRCDEAREIYREASLKVKKAKSRVEDATSPPRRRRAKKKLHAALRRLASAKAQVAAECD